MLTPSSWESGGNREPVEVGQHHVEHDEVGVALLCRCESGAPRRCLGDLVALVSQRRGDGVDQRRLVVDHQNAHVRCGWLRHSPILAPMIDLRCRYQAFYASSQPALSRHYTLGAMVFDV